MCYGFKNNQNKFPGPYVKTNKFGDDPFNQILFLTHCDLSYFLSQKIEF